MIFGSVPEGRAATQFASAGKWPAAISVAVRLVAGVADGPVEEVIGPHFINGGWWMRELTRAYYYVRTRSGRWLWIYHDQKRRRWYLQGEVQ